jgi:hypothetical protein
MFTSSRRNPAVVHGLAGLADAQQNCWPMILIGGASETYRRGMGAFQEERQVLLAAPLCKFAHAIDSVKRIPYYVAEATRNATYGRPGAAYLDMPDDIITGKCDDKDIVQVQKCPDPPRFQAPPENVDAALNMLERAERPLILVGKGMAWANAEKRGALLYREDASAVPALADGQGHEHRRRSPYCLERQQLCQIDACECGYLGPRGFDVDWLDCNQLVAVERQYHQIAADHPASHASPRAPSRRWSTPMTAARAL